METLIPTYESLRNNQIIIAPIVPMGFWGAGGLKDKKIGLGGFLMIFLPIFLVINMSFQYQM